MAIIKKFPLRVSIEKSGILNVIYKELKKNNLTEEIEKTIISRMSSYIDFVADNFKFQHEAQKFSVEQLLFIQEQLRNYFNAIVLERLSAEIYFYNLTL